MSDMAWKAAERIVARKLGTRRTPLSGGNSAHTRSDTLHHELFVEVKLRKRPPLWEEMRSLSTQARRVDREPLLVVDEARGRLRLGATSLDVLASGMPDLGAARLFDDFLVQHLVLRRSALFAFWADVEAMAMAEAKRPLLVFKASGRPGELAAWRPPPRTGGRGAFGRRDTVELSITEQKAQLWISGFDPGAQGWRALGPADDDEVIEVAQGLRGRGVEVATFVSPMGKLSYYARGSPAEA